MPPSRYGKRGDTYEPVEGVLSDANGPFDLRGASLRFLAKVVIGGVETIIDSDSISPVHGICVNVEDETGLQADRGRYRFEPTEAAVSVASKPEAYACEIEARMPNSKLLTFPSREENNPEWQLDPDIEP